MSEQPIESVPAKVRNPRKISPFWLLPIVAFAIGAMLFLQILKEQGENITIQFNEGDGITAGKTMIRYQGMQIGQVKRVYFINDMKNVQVEAEINAEAKSVLKEGTKFWLVKPTASLAGVSGLDALVSGNYITLQPGDSSASNRYDFIAEEEVPTVTVSDGDLLVRLVADDLGSIDIGAKVYYRKVPVGSIAGYRFAKDQKKVEIDLVIDDKYANLVKQNSHFWNISGINAEASFAGVKVDVDSLSSMVFGAVAFDSPEDSPAAEQGQQFTLFDSVKSAKRGTEVNITLPMVANLNVNETAVYYQNVQIGVLSDLNIEGGHTDTKDTLLDKNTPTLSGKLIIDPNHADLLRSTSSFIIREPKFSLNTEQFSKISELLRGVYLEVIKGDEEGEPATSFTAIRDVDFALNLPNVIAFKLTAPQAYGVAENQGIYFNDVQVGLVLKRKVDLNGVTFDALIFPSYSHLISGTSQFVAVSNINMSFGLEGMRVHAGSPSEWLRGGVRLITSSIKGEPKKQYPLFKDIESAEAGITNDEKKATLTLTANELNGIDKGSVLLYRQFQVGEVLAVKPKQNKFEVELYIEPKHRNLLTDKSRFWVEPAVNVEASLSGVNLQSAPLMRMLKGAISFDNGGSNGNKTLYTSKERATSGHTYIQLVARDGSKLSKGMPIKYMGLTIGKVESLSLDKAKKQVNMRAFIEGEYYGLIAKAGSKFRAVSPEIDTTGFKNLDAMLQNYINVEVGDGARKTQFLVSDTDSVASQYRNGFPIIVETADANGITPEAPVMFRGMQVGIVQRLSLSELGDRVLLHVRIENKYKHLIRKNTEFWATTGYTMDVSLNGISMNSGSMTQLLNGGITFSTPSGRVVQPQAEANRRFRLQRKTPDEAYGWDQGFAQ